MPSSQKPSTVPVGDLAARFKKLTVQHQTVEDEKEYEAVQSMTLEELSKETIEFGKTYVGRPFPSLMGETRYVTWFVNTFKDSRQAKHAKFIRYIQLYVADLEKNPLQAKSKSYPKAKGKSQPKGYYVDQVAAPSMPPSDSEEEEFDPMDPLPSGSWEQVDHHLPSNTHSAEMTELRDRLHKMEDVMQQVLHHLSQQASHPGN